MKQNKRIELLYNERANEGSDMVFQQVFDRVCNLTEDKVSKKEFEDIQSGLLCIDKAAFYDGIRVIHSLFTEE